VQGAAWACEELKTCSGRKKMEHLLRKKTPASACDGFGVGL